MPRLCDPVRAAPSHREQKATHDAEKSAHRGPPPIIKSGVSEPWLFDLAGARSRGSPLRGLDAIRNTCQMWNSVNPRWRKTVRSMSRIKKTLWVALPILTLVVLVGWRYNTKKATEAEQAQEQSARQGGAPAVELAAAGPRTIVQGVEAVGTAEAAHRAALSPKVGGRIEYLTAREGDAVQAGQVLVRIDPSEIHAQVLQQEANVAQARARLAQAQLNENPTEVGVQGQIRQQNAGLASARAEYEQANSNIDAQIASADAAVAQSESRLRGAQALAGNAQSVLEREQASLANAETRLTRTESLYKQGFIAAQEVDDARTAVEVQKKTVLGTAAPTTSSLRWARRWSRKSGAARTMVQRSSLFRLLQEI